MHAASGLSRTVRKRLRRRQARVTRANLVIAALNELWGGEAERGMTPMRERAQNTILKRVAMDLPVHSPTLATVNELLRMSLSYAGDLVQEPALVAPYRKGLTSLPETTSGCPRAEEVLDASGGELLRSFESTMLLPDSELGWCFERQKEISPYMDVVLSRSNKAYLEFLVDLSNRGLISWRRSASSVACPFFVLKKDGIKRRLILDCRQTNVLFRDPPQMRMASGSKLADLRLLPNDKLYVAKSDVKDFFYNIRLDGKLCEYFSMPSISCRDVLRYFHENGLRIPQELHDLVVMNVGTAWPCFTAVPMGWKWAMYIAQRIHTRICLEGSRLDSSCVLEEGVIPPVLGDSTTFLLPYVDNLNVLGTSADMVDTVLHRIVGKLRATGFTVHEIETARCSTSVLGYKVDGETGTISCKDDKLRAVREAWLRLSRGLPVSGHGVEKLLGFTIHFMLLFRPLLSIPHHLYRFARDTDGCRRLWPSAAREAFLLSQLLLFCSCNIRQQVCPVVSVSDASLTGYAVCTSTWMQADIGSVTRHKERYRYKATDPLFTRARASALSDYGDVLSDPNTVIPQNGPEEIDPLEPNPSFAEVPRRLLRTSSWCLRFCKPYLLSEPITLLETRACLKSVQHKLRDQRNWGQEHLHLGDNLAMILGLEKGRLAGGASRTKYLAVCRRIASLLAVTESRMLWRWIPSELNPADAGSRRWEPNKDAKATSSRRSSSDKARVGKYQSEDPHLLPEEQSRVSHMATRPSWDLVGCTDYPGARRADGGVLSSPLDAGTTPGTRSASLCCNAFPRHHPGPSGPQQFALHTSSFE
eukprot:6466486-Amphidinium_carterae.2